jgi:hypothetical protein
MNQEQTIKLIKHQSLMVRMPWEYPHIQDHFGVMGYAAGKTSGLGFVATDIAKRYWKYPIEVGLFAPTLTFMKKTLVTQLEKLFIQSGTKYNYNKQENIIKIGHLKFVLIPIDQPKNIYGHNLCASLCDELDELPQDVAMEAYRAVSERTRIDFPDGKKPFSMFATTAQGYRGTYQIIEELKEAGVGYTHIRGLTKDNIYGVSDEYFQKLWALYDENERMAFLEGRFVNLTAGRVYPGYDEAKCMAEPFDIGDRETVYVGQDLNEGYSKATAWIVRNRILYAIKEWSFKDIGLAAKEIRIAFPTQEIRWYPDSSGRVVMAGYTHEYSEQGIMPQFAAVNPARLERVFVLNKLFYMGRAKVFKTLRELPMALKTRQYDDKGDPEKGKGAKSPDHICFSGDTLIATQRGMVRIDSIVPGDLAFTRNGLREIENAWCTGEFETHEYQINGMKVRSTDNHPVITMDGKKEISSLTQKDIVLMGFPEYKPVRAHVERNSGGRIEKVYNLTVKGDHEYFANGLLVSNCDSADYATHRVISSNTEFTDLWELTSTFRRDRK